MEACFVRIKLICSSLFIMDLGRVVRREQSSSIAIDRTKKSAQFALSVL